MSTERRLIHAVVRQRDQDLAARVILSDLARSLGAQTGAFYRALEDADRGRTPVATVGAHASDAPNRVRVSVGSGGDTCGVIELGLVAPLLRDDASALYGICRAVGSCLRSIASNADRPTLLLEAQRLAAQLRLHLHHS